MNPFEFVNSINNTKEDIMDGESEKHYNSFLVNRSLSYFPDTVLYSNEMNKYHHMDAKLQYHFLINSIRKRKRFCKWEKPESLDVVEVIKEYYGYNDAKARQALTLLNDNQISELRKKVSHGGQRK